MEENSQTETEPSPDLLEAALSDLVARVGRRFAAGVEVSRPLIEALNHHRFAVYPKALALQNCGVKSVLIATGVVLEPGEAVHMSTGGSWVSHHKNTAPKVSIEPFLLPKPPVKSVSAATLETVAHLSLIHI